MSSNLKDILDQIEQEVLQGKEAQAAPQVKAKETPQVPRDTVVPSTPSTSYEEKSEHDEYSYEQEPSRQRRRKRKRSVSSSNTEKTQSRILLYTAIALCTAILVSAFFIVRVMSQRFSKKDKAALQTAAPKRNDSTKQAKQDEQSILLPSAVLAPQDKSKELFDPNLFGLPKEEEQAKEGTEKPESKLTQ